MVAGKYFSWLKRFVTQSEVVRFLANNLEAFPTQYLDKTVDETGKISDVTADDT